MRGTPSAVVRRIDVQQPNDVSPYVGTEVRVAHRHLDRGVAEQLLDRLERRTAHHEVRSEGVPQYVPSDPAQAGLLARAPQGPLADALGQHPPPFVAEHQLASKVTERRQIRTSDVSVARA